MAPNDTDWTGTLGGDWSDPTDWSAGVPQTPDAQATIGGTDEYAVTIAAGESYDVGSVTIDDYLATLEIAGTLETASGLFVTAGTAAVVGSGHITGPITVGYRGVLEEAGAAASTLVTGVTLAGGTIGWDTDAGAASTTLDAAIAAGVVVSGYGQLEALYPASVTLTNAGTLLADQAGQLLNVNFASLANDGLIEADDSAYLYVGFYGEAGDVWTNDGTVAISDATARFGAFDNAGVVSVTGGLLQIGAQTETIDPGTGDYVTSFTGFVNTGTVIATDSVVQLAGDETVADLGSLALSSSTLELYEGTLDNTGGTLDGSDAAVVGLVLDGGTIEGGTIDLASLGLQAASTGSDLDNTTLLGTLTLNGGVTLSGTTSLYADASLTTPGAIVIGAAGRVAFAGDGPFTLTNQVALYGGALTWETLAGDGGIAAAFGDVTPPLEVTIASAVQIAGYGEVVDGFNDTSDDVLNLGTILADYGYEELQVGLATFANAGLMEATADADLVIGERFYSYDSDTGTEITAYSSFTNTGTILANGGTVGLEGDETVGGLGTLLVENGGVVQLLGILENAGSVLSGADLGLVGLQLAGGTIVGGTLDVAAFQPSFVQDTASTLDDVTVIGSLYVAGDLTLAGTTAVYADASQTTPGEISVVYTQIQFAAGDAQTLTSDLSLTFGQVAWTDASDSGTGTIAVTIAAGATISGDGFLGATPIYGQSDAITNAGTLDATHFSEALQIESATFTNTGVVMAGSASVLSIAVADFTNLAGGVLSGGTYVALSEATLQIDDAGGDPLAVTTDAADIVLSGTNAYAAFEGGLTAVAASGTLEIDDNAGLGTSNPLSVAGLVMLGGGTITATDLDLSAGGTLQGAGVVIAAGGITLGTVPVTAEGGALTLDGPIAGAGSFRIAAAATLAIAGTESQDVALGIDSTLVLSGAGTLATGTISGFAAGDQLILDGFDGDSATFADGTLSVAGSEGTLSFAVAGSFAADAFSASVPTLGETVVQLSQAATLAVSAPATVLDDPGAVIAISGAVIQDGADSTLTVTVTDRYGVLAAYPRDGGVAQGNGTGTLVLSGDLAAVDGELQTLQYQAPGVGQPADTIAITGTDSGGTDSGGAVATALIDVIIDQPPTIALPTDFFVEPSVTGSLGGISVSDPDAALSGTYTVTLSDVAGTLTVPAAGVTATGDGSTALTVSGSLAAVNAAIGSLTAELATDDTLTITANDGLGGSASAVAPIYADVPPVLVAPGTILDDAGTPVAVAVTLTDDYGAAAGDLFSVTLAVGAGTLSIPVAGSADVTGSGTGNVTIQGSYGAVAAVLGDFDYEWSGIGSDTLGIAVNDGHGGTADATVPIDSIADVAPTLALPPTALVSAEAAESLGDLGIADSDAVAVGKTLTVTLTDATGTLAADAQDGGSVSGSGTTRLVLTGALPAVAAELAGLSYTGAIPGTAPDATASDSVIVTADDGRGGTATGTIAVTVDQVAYAPPGVVGPTAGPTLTASTPGLLGGFSITDPYAAATLGTISVEVSALTGTLDAIASGAGLVFGDGSNQLLLVGTLADVNAALASLTYAGAAAGAVSDTTADVVTVTAGDSRGNGGTYALGVTVDQTALYGGFQLSLETYLADQQNGAGSAQLASDALATYVAAVAGAIGSAGGGLWQSGYTGASQAATAAVADEGGSGLTGGALAVFEAIVAAAAGAIAADADADALAQIQAAAAALGADISARAASATLQADLSSLFGALAIAAGSTITDPAWQGAYQGSLPAEATLAADLANGAGAAQVVADAGTLFDSVLDDALGATLGGAAQQAYAAQATRITTVAGDLTGGVAATQVQSDLAGIFNAVVTQAIAVAQSGPSPNAIAAAAVSAADGTITVGEAAYADGFATAQTVLGSESTVGSGSLDGSERAVTLSQLAIQIGSLDGPQYVAPTESLVGLATGLETALTPGTASIDALAASGSSALSEIFGPEGDAEWQQYTLDYLAAATTLYDATHGETGYDTAAIGTFYNTVVDDILDIAGSSSAAAEATINAAVDALSTASDDSDGNAALAALGSLFGALVGSGDAAVQDTAIGVESAAASTDKVAAADTGQAAINWFSDNLSDVGGAVIAGGLYFAGAFEATAPLAALGPAYGYVAGAIFIYAGFDLYVKSLDPNDPLRKNWNSFKKNPGFVIGQGINAAGKKIAHAFGDVHITTFDGLYYNFQAAGEFVFAKSTAPGDQFQLQVRLQPFDGSTTVTVMTQVAAAVGQGSLTFDAFRADTVALNGQAYSLVQGVPTDVGGATLTQLSAASWEIDYANGETVTVSKAGGGANAFINVDVALPTALGGEVEGLLGNANGTAANDLTTADGTVLPAPLSSADLYTTFADAWRVTQASSLLSYAPGQTTATFTDASFPSEYVDLTGLPASVLANAANLVSAAGIADSGAAQGALEDYLLTGNPDFINADAIAGGTQTTALMQPDPAGTMALSLGIADVAPSVVAQADGTTDVSFLIYATGAGTVDQTVSYAVVAPDTTYLGAPDFSGDVLPGGSLVIAAGTTLATLTLGVTGALGDVASAGLEVQIASGSGTPVIATTAVTTVTNPSPVPGTAAAPVFLDPSGIGSFSQSGTVFTLDLGTIVAGTAVGEFNIDLVNQAIGGADTLSGSFSQSGSPIVIFPDGLGSVTALAGGEVDTLRLDLATGLAGPISSAVTFFATEGNASGFSAGLGDIVLDVVGEIACYATGTRILTAQGEVPVEDLAVGMRAITASGAERPIRWVGRRRLTCASHPRPNFVWPVRIAAGAFAEGCPTRDLWLSPDHCVFMDGLLIPVRHLANGRTIRQVPRETVEYWHVELDRHDVLLAEGLPAESYLDVGNRHAFEGGAVLALHPVFAVTAGRAGACAELVQDGPRLAAAKRALFRRAGPPPAPFAPSLRVLAGDRALVPRQVGPALLCYAVAPGTRVLRLLSPSWSPAECDEAALDHRRLGVRILGITTGGRNLDLAAANLLRGFHAVEHTAEGAARWTDGDAVLVLPDGCRDVLLRLGDGAARRSQPRRRPHAVAAA